MLIFRPISSPYISQRFGENKACVKNGTYSLITKTGDTCPAGYQDFYQSLGMRGHNGIDRRCIYREKIHFDSPDFETKWDMYAELDGAQGMGIAVVSKTPVLRCREPGCPETHHIKRIYWHCAGVVADIPASGDDKELSVKELYLLLAGEERIKIRSNVQAGDLLGFGDSTGASSGNHVHDATKWCDEKGDGIHSDNGYYGAFDDSDMRVERFILDELKERKEEEARMAENYGKFEQARLIREQIVQKQLELIPLLRQLVLALQQALISMKRKVGTLVSK